MNKARFQLFCKILLVYTLLVILWGAWVRISHSGDGCGASWPKCQDQFVPDLSHQKTFTEYFHRAMSGFYGVFVLLMYFYARQIFPLKSNPRKIAATVLVFMVIEALLGAKLVLLKLVGQDDSIMRLLAISLHQINSLLLTGSIFLLYKSTQQESVDFYWKDFFYWPFLFILMFAVTGTWAALSTTLFPTQDLLQGFFQDFDPESPLLLRLRAIHPIIALLGATGLARFFYKNSKPLSAIFCLMILVGLLTLLLKSPVPLKLVHLLLVHLIWILLLNHAVISLDSIRR